MAAERSFVLLSLSMCENDQCARERGAHAWTHTVEMDCQIICAWLPSAAEEIHSFSVTQFLYFSGRSRRSGVWHFYVCRDLYLWHDEYFMFAHTAHGQAAASMYVSSLLLLWISSHIWWRTRTATMWHVPMSQNRNTQQDRVSQTNALICPSNCNCLTQMEKHNLCLLRKQKKKLKSFRIEFRHFIFRNILAIRGRWSRFFFTFRS